MAKRTRKPTPHSEKVAALEPLIERLNAFSADNYWDLGKFLVDKVIPTALKQGIFGDEILKQMSDLPGFKFPYHMLKHCQRFYSYYPDLGKRPLPEEFYFELSTRVDESRKRDQYEKLAISSKWTISDLQKRVRDDELARRQDEKTKYGFDLKERNIWSFEAPDPRFGKSGFKGRLPGQVVANALFYYTGPGTLIVDPMAGSGTTGDVVESISAFSDRKVKMYDIEPSDARIARVNILQTGIPDQSSSVDYVFLDPPHDLYPAGDEPEFSPGAARSDTMMKLKTIMREGARILKKGGRLSIVVEAVVGGFGVIDFPYDVASLARELGLVQIGKVYLPRRTDAGRPRIPVAAESVKPMASDCRELLTFEKP
jgi:hypothetical protein